MKDIKAVGLRTLAKRLGTCKNRLAYGGPFLEKEYDLLCEIQRRLNFIVKHKNQCDCPWSADCEHLDVLGNCGMRYGK